ncbi:MAG: hypothetical protein ACLQBX_00105, partial [Candidatus Limnocylindrales bacterium]
MNSRLPRINVLLFWLAAALVGFLLFSVLVSAISSPATSGDIPYSGGSDSFLGLVKAGDVAQIVEQGTSLSITLNDTAHTVKTSQVPGTLGDTLLADIRAT